MTSMWNHGQEGGRGDGGMGESEGGSQCALQHHSRQCGEEPSGAERSSDSVCGVHTTAEPEQLARTDRAKRSGTDPTPPL